MRLAQLARKIGITQSEIVNVLSGKGLEISENGNSKLSEEEVELIYAHFNIESEQDTPLSDAVETPQTIEEPVAAEEEESKEAQTDIAEVEQPKVDDNEIAAGLKEESTSDEPDSAKHLTSTDPGPSDEEIEAEKEVIRAKKVKLEGIKVLGKIELPEPKEKLEEEPKEPKKEKLLKKKTDKRNKRKSKGRKQLSYSEKIKREEEQALREKKKKERRIKEKKKKHYFEKVQPKVAAKPKKKTTQKKVKNTTPKRVKPQYKNPIRKFWAWLNGEYDV